MSKKKRPVIKDPNKWFSKIRPFLFPVIFGLGALGAYFINVNDLMNKVGSTGNSGIQITWFIQVCTYFCVIGLIVLGYQFEAQLEKRK
jgi:hypothetical protein